MSNGEDAQRLRNELEQARARLQKIQDEKETLKQQCDKRKKELEVQEAANLGLRTRVTLQRQTLNELETRLEQLKRQVDLLEKEKTTRHDLLNNMRKNKEEQDRLEAECRDLHEQSESIRTLCSELNENVYKLFIDPSRVGPYPWQGTLEEKMGWIRQFLEKLKVLKAS